MDHTRHDRVSHFSRTARPCVLPNHMCICLQTSYGWRGTPSLGVRLHSGIRGRSRTLGHGPYFSSSRRLGTFLANVVYRSYSFQGLTPILYWRHHDEILTTRSSDLPDLVRSLVSSSSHTDYTMDIDQPLVCGTPIQRISGRLSICNAASLRRPDLLQVHQDIAFVCLEPHDPTGVSRDESRMLSIQTPQGKKGQHHFLTVVLPRSMPFIQRHLQNQRTVCIACNTGTDISVGVALAALAMFFRPDGSWYPQGNARDELCTWRSMEPICLRN